MFTKTVTCDNVTVVVSRAVKGTRIIAAIFFEALARVYPEIKELNVPISPDEDDKSPEGKKAIAEHSKQVVALITKHPLEWERYNTVREFSNIAARIVSVAGTEWQITNRNEYPSEDYVKAAYQHFLYDATGLWSAIIDAISIVNEPIAPLEQRIGALLTEPERSDPNANGSTELLLSK